MDESAPSLPAPAAPRRNLFRSSRWQRLLPPARLLWICLAILGWSGTEFLHGLGLLSLLALPLLAVLVDLGFQRVRFPHVRFPDAALATGLFLALIFSPEANLVLAGAATFAAVAVRHALRFAGHPWMNPAAVGVLLGAVFLGLVPGWWVGIGPFGLPLLAGLGAAVAVRSWRSWRLPTAFLVSFALFAAAEHLVVGLTLSPHVLLLEAVDPVTVFVGLFMVVEPRTAPRDPMGQALFGMGTGLAAATLPLALPTVGILVALLVGNLGFLTYRMLHARWRTAPSRTTSRRSGKNERPSSTSLRWPIGFRVGTMFLVLMVFVGVAASFPPPAAQPLLATNPHSGGGGSGGLTSCAHDNPSIPASTLSSLHRVLGPSVILSYNPSSGVVVFYDPVDRVTVTETDLYEDFGAADFNGDDYAVSGCSP